jgi:hypothetical protein
MQGHRPSMTGHRITLPENLGRSFSNRRPSTANVAKLPPMGGIGATDAERF